ncbi:acyltransferase family protein [Phenylobacterium montanum]|uniref:Acyltransferase n=1 Tax=Phenylobacterium montanum TaxID=2823693 RepID=A0A975G039_9CAUL|nr:acyltransferase [Caulobacter sp. S6]QUD88058.1 acyltransferase [Caulobacter sp. S6]
MVKLQPPHRIKGFDGIRAIAVFGVFLMHKTALGERYELGAYGVWLFFLLSGFLITSQLVAARERVEEGGESCWSELGGFWWRRSFRILPPYYALLIVLAGLYALWRRPVPALSWHFLYATNWYAEFHPQVDLGTWQHFWSLAIEEQFYLVFAPLLILTPRRWAPWWCGGLIAAGVLRRIWMVEAGWPPFSIYVDSLVNMASLAVGGLGGLIVRRHALRGEWIGWAALAGFLVLPFCLGALGWSNSISPLLALAFGLIAILALHGNQAGPLANLLSWPPIAYFGRISYGFYLYESYPPSQLAAGLAHHGGVASEVEGALFAFFASLAISVASYELLEMPIQRLGRSLRIGRVTPEPA